jgi:hypothetical protein
MLHICLRFSIDPAEDLELIDAAENASVRTFSARSCAACAARPGAASAPLDGERVPGGDRRAARRATRAASLAALPRRLQPSDASRTGRAAVPPPHGRAIIAADPPRASGGAAAAQHLRLQRSPPVLRDNDSQSSGHNWIPLQSQRDPEFFHELL